MWDVGFLWIFGQSETSIFCLSQSATDKNPTNPTACAHPSSSEKMVIKIQKLPVMILISR
jgi:hypothetical protein